jgi:hypothetical protein
MDRSSPASLNTARGDITRMVGDTNTAALAFGGYTTAIVSNTESWNGTSWTQVNDLNFTARYGLAGAGTNTAALEC